jgi:hypothetical protein
VLAEEPDEYLDAMFAVQAARAARVADTAEFGTDSVPWDAEER